MLLILTVWLCMMPLGHSYAHFPNSPTHYIFVSDSDGIPDASDLDDDNDGIPDITEGSGDTDNDGILDRLDLDSDGDGISDIIEAGGTDVDGDGEVDGFVDANMDGLHDPLAASPLPTPDTDEDGFSNFQDIDSDGDGIIDNIEGQASTLYIPPLEFDADNDGLDDAYDSNSSGTAIIPVDKDEDGIVDYLDSNSDNDAEGDVIEGWDDNGNGSPEVTPSGSDSDNDGLDNAFDVDGPSIVNNGGSTNFGSLPTDFPDADNPGIGDLDWRENDTDGDGVSNLQDLDDDNDGIPDYVELCGPGETTFSCTADPQLDDDVDGIPNYMDSDFCTLNAWGVCEDFDTDNDGIIDPFDLDSDNDGISDLFETKGKDGNLDAKVDDLYADGSLMYDSNNDGISDSSITTHPGNLDQLTKPDFQDLDADNDGVYDILENGGIDINKDGRVDAALPDGSLVDDPEDDGLSNSTAATFNLDTDNDGEYNYADLDSDNDGMSDLFENGQDDVNGDGMLDAHVDIDEDGADDTQMIDDAIDSDEDEVPNYRDLDSDNDLISDGEEAGIIDLDGDGSLDNFVDDNGDGWDDLNPVSNPLDTDGDNIPDYLDLDSDDDIIRDIVEGGRISNDFNFDGLVDGFTDANLDGWHDEDHLSTNNVPDTDGDGTADYRDLDSDGDGALDEFEWDSNSDGSAPDDCNDDGIYDWVDREACDVKVPQGFSPDGDGINDTFVLTGADFYEEGKLTVFNRWGKKVYESINYQNDWDGTNQFAGDGTKELPVGTYFYIFEPNQTNADGDEIEPTKGFVYIQR
ncbi:MAG: gliding motility-associated C-terminal domain-containing protein [Flavobacteriales bacterium]|nr:gliding motility-associated C-terminal domain-containing protein [Flavobacteriales bacterium]